jgi:hypothetical protein
VVLVGVLLVVCGLVHGVNADGWPGRVNDDEGTYAAQAYAVQVWGRIAPYTYWYDHPFGGWLLIAGYTWVTGAFGRASTTVGAVRECMLVVHLVSVVLLYGVARRVGCRRGFAGLAVVLFSWGPLGVWYQRLAFLDNLVVLWVLAALVLAASPRRSAAAAAGAGVCLGCAVWSKETAVLLAPGVYGLLVSRWDRRNRRFVHRNFLGMLVGVCGMYLVYAGVKGEVLPGPGHVSLWSAVRWQVVDRPGSGSVWQAGSGTRGLVVGWWRADPVLLGVGLVAAVAALGVRRLRMIGLVVLVAVGMLGRDGYTPYAYVTAVLPFLALAVAGVLDALLPRRRPTRPAGAGSGPELAGAGPPPAPPAAPAVPGVAGAPAVWWSRWAGWLRPVRVGLVVVVLVAGELVLPGRWLPTIRTAWTADDSRPSREATRWYREHVPAGMTVVTDDNIWTDLVRAGVTPAPIWFYKVDLDPAVRGRVPHGWRDIDYFVMGAVPSATLRDLPTVAEGLRHSVVVAAFGPPGDQQVTVRKVITDSQP